MENENADKAELNEQKLLYEKNVLLLKRYPYIMMKGFPDFDQLDIIWKLNREGKRIMYDSRAEECLEIYKNESERTNKAFFQDLSRQLLIKNETNPWNLKYLCDNVRRSEDYGGDNHIYLYYDSFRLFCAYLKILDIEPYLTDAKIVFLFGPEQLSAYYPLDFKKIYGIDYSQMKNKQIRIDEMNRICVFHFIGGSSGTAFVSQIMDYHRTLFTIRFPFALTFEYFYKLVQGKTVLEMHKLFQQKIAINLEPGFTKTVIDKVFGMKKLFHKMALSLRGIGRPTKGEWFKAFYLAYNYTMNRKFTERIVPVIYYDSHELDGIEGIKSAFEILPEFRYVTMLSVIRDTTCQFSSLANWAMHEPFAYNLPYEKVKSMRDEYLLPSYIANYYKELPHRETTAETFIDKYVRKVRFEDLKLYPKATLYALCEFMDIPWDENLLHCTYDGLPTEKEMISGRWNNWNNQTGFDPSTVHKRERKNCSDLDFMRIELLSFGLYRHYGYKSKFYLGEALAREEILTQCIPFFTSDLIEINHPNFDKRAFQRKRYQFIQFLVEWIYSPESDLIRSLHPIKWMKPKEEMVNGPLYE